MAEAAPQVRAVSARVVDLQGRRQLLDQGVRDGDAVLADAAGAHPAGECGDEHKRLPVEETSGLENKGDDVEVVGVVAKFLRFPGDADPMSIGLNLGKTEEAPWTRA